jgi:hypothetical protein
MKYCDIHGPVEVKEGAPPGCPEPLGGNRCGTILTDEPQGKWVAIMGNRIPALAGVVRASPPDEIVQSNARALNRRQGAFLAAYEKCGRVCEAAEAADIARQTHYDWLKNDPSYKLAFEQSEVIVGQNLMDEAVRRAMHGWEEPTTVAGSAVLVRRFSDRLLERLLEAHHPEKFRANLAHRLVDRKGEDRQLFDVAELDKLMREADQRDKEGS